MGDVQQSTPAGWYPDASGVTRWWDGQQWGSYAVPVSVVAPVRPSNGVAVASLIFGIFGVLLTLTVVPAIIAGVVAIVMGVVGLSLAHSGARGGTLAVWGIVLGAVPVVFLLVALLVSTVTRLSA